ncbi:MAG: SBBP repeat-containing protein [Roseimicrobium sp.]
MKTITKRHRHSRKPSSLLGLLAASVLTLSAGGAPAQHFGSAFRAGGAGNDETTDIVRDKDGNIYTSGFFMETVDFDPGPGIAKLTSAGGYDVYVAKYDHDNQLIWARRVGGPGTDFSHAMALDASGNVVITGSFEETADFNPGPATFNLISAGEDDSFVCKLDTNGNLLWAKRLGGTGRESAHDVAVDALGNVVTVGRFSGTADFDPNLLTNNLTAVAFQDIYISKLSSNGLFVWAKSLGGSGGGDDASAVTVDAAGNVYTTGSFNGTNDFDPGPGITSIAATAASSDVFIHKLNSAGIFQWVKRIGGNSQDSGNDIALDTAGNIHVIGDFFGIVDFDPNGGVFQLNSANGSSFVNVLNKDGVFLWAKNTGGSSDALAVDSLGNILLTGKFDGTVDFDTGPGTFLLTSTSTSSDVFVSKLDSLGNLVFAVRMGGADFDFGECIITDAVSSNVWCAGYFGATGDYDPGNGVFNLENAGPEGIFDSFVVRLTTHSKVLWSDEEGNATLLTVDGCGDKVDSKSYSVPGFVATSYDRTGEGAVGRILWSDVNSGKALVWLLDSSDDVKLETAIENKPGWKAVSYRVGFDGSGKILWEHTDGTKQFWTVDFKGKFVCATEFENSSGWSVRTFCR